MFRIWTMILPFFIIKWLAKRKLEQIDLKLIDGNWIVVNPYSDTIFIISEDRTN